MRGHGANNPLVESSWLTRGPDQYRRLHGLEHVLQLGGTGQTLGCSQLGRPGQIPFVPIHFGTVERNQTTAVKQRDRSVEIITGNPRRLHLVA